MWDMLQLVQASEATPRKIRPRASRIKGLIMLENINLGRKLSREEYKSVLPALQQRLYDLEKAC
jgi:hypothetical protein